ncbi:MAG: hypothetical protein Q7T33_09195 [Dehalococcoidia bacterium]|nr:hypothetical protein [Dehalococcoidia bacterium]
MKQAPSKRRPRASRKGTKVGTFRYRFEIAAAVDGPFQAIDGLVDTGSLYTWIPRPTLAALGVKPTERLEFLMANGERVYRDAAEVVIRLDNRFRHSICVFGDGKDLILLGALTLEQFTLAVDPANERLVPMPAIPAASTEGGARTIK